MAWFKVAVLDESDRLAWEERICVPEMASVWPRLASIVEAHHRPGLRVVVTNEDGGIVLTAAVSIARRLLGGYRAAA